MLPFVSIIVPVKNEALRLPSVVGALRALDYPKDRYEIIIADNGSTDGTLEIAHELLVVVCQQPRGGSYAARNKGISIAQGEILAFTDGDCTPHPGWLSAGVARLSSGPDLVAGAINFISHKDTIAHRFDRKFFLQQERWVQEKGTGATANLFVKRTVIEKTGGFSEALSSGGDFAFCRAASAAGFSIVFEPQAIVDHPTRGFSAILRKARRIGSGKVERLLHTNTTTGQVMPQKRQLKSLLAGEPFATQLGFFCIYFAVCCAGGVGAISYLIRTATVKKRSKELPAHSETK